MLGVLSLIYGQLSVPAILALLSTAFLLVHLVPYFLDPYRLRSYPGPFLARFTDAWLGLVAKAGHRSETVHQLHLKYGPFVRLAPNHLSVAEPDALQVVYGHGNGALKSNFYDAFVSIRRGLFNTRDRIEHTRKRKIISHVFSQKNVIEFEPHIRSYVGAFIKQWDRLCDGAVKGRSGTEGEKGWTGRDGWLWLDLLPWANYLAFDIIGDLAFGAPFGMIEAAKDFAVVPLNNERAMDMYGSKAAAIDVVEIPAVQILNGRGDYSASMGVLPPWWRPFVRHIPWYKKGQKDVKALAGIAIMAVAKRLGTPTDRVDLLSKLQQCRDGNGDLMSREELTAEALTLLIAGSDTTSNSTCAIIYYIARDRRVQDKLHKELDDELGAEDETVATLQQMKRLPYLDACINEGLRLHSTSSLGLPRLAPKGGFEVMGHCFPEGTILSVPSYTIHRDKKVWGEDVEVYRPERWFEGDIAAMQKTFNPFSVGPRACVGRNLAVVELQIIVASIMRRYCIVLENPSDVIQTREGFLRKPLACNVGIKRRHPS